MFKLVRYVKKYKKQFIAGPAFKLIEAIFELIVPLVMAKIIDVGVANGDKEYVLHMGVVMVILYIIGLCNTLVCQRYAALASQGIGTDLRNDIYKKINSLSFAELDKIGSSSLINRLTTDVNQLQVAVAMLIRLFVRAPFLVLGSTVMAFTINAKLAVIFVLIIPLVAVSIYLVMSRSVPFFKAMQKKMDTISRIVKENLGGVRVIRAFSRQREETERFEFSSEDYMNAGINAGKISALLNPVCYFILNSAIVAILWFGGTSVNSGEVTQGEIIALINYMTQISLTLVVIANLVVIFTKAEAAAARVNEIFDTETSVTEGNGAATKKNAPKIEFDKVSFSYNHTGNYALENFSLKIEKGETVGIIGSTGSGKSTLINLIPRFYDVEEGRILIDGADVRSYTFTALRGQIGVVPQKTSLFSGTVADNLRMGKEDATSAELEKAVRIAQAGDIIERMPDGYETLITEGGKNLSGGQKQRLTIARALVKDPEILILDDSASALDYVTDRNLRRAIKEETSDITVIIVSQRAAAIRFADKIVVLDDGQAVAVGKHDELFDTCEIYKEICTSQEVTK